MTDEEFLKSHGLQWAKIIQMNSFTAGMIRLTLEATARIQNLSDEEIKENSVVILSDLRGRLKHEAELFALPIPPEEPPPEIREEVVNQEEEFFKEQQRINRKRK